MSESVSVSSLSGFPVVLLILTIHPRQVVLSLKNSTLCILQFASVSIIGSGISPYSEYPEK